MADEPNEAVPNNPSIMSEVPSIPEPVTEGMPFGAGAPVEGYAFPGDLMRG